MDYSIKNCPKCNRELHVPTELKTCICMFCGESFDLPDIKAQVISEATRQIIELDYRKSLEGISSLLQNVEQQLFKFTKDRYSTNFELYVQTGISILQPIERFAALLEENVEKVAEETAQGLIEAIEKAIAQTKGGLIKTSKNTTIDQYRFFLTIYTVPMIRFLNYSISEPLADHIIEKWHNRHPGFSFNKGSYEKLQEGFVRKGFCFITTAVCETMNKADDCYELTSFRKFRDTYMQETKERQALVEEYYLIAPAIVASIDLLTNRKDKYSDIWREYLQPCLKNIEENRLDLCEKHYSNMVQKLKIEYNISVQV